MTLDDARTKSEALWNEMSAGWDSHSDYIWQTSRPVGEWMVEQINPQPGQTILELAAGAGMTGFVAAKLIGEDGKLISTDFAQNMVNVAEKTAANLGVHNAEFRQMDAEKMDLPDDSVDAVLCRWGYMLMMDPQAALKETRRVLKPGGKVAFSVWSPPKDNPWASIPSMVMVSLGKMQAPDPNAPGGLFSMADPSTIEALVGTAGFTKWQIEPIEVTWRFKDPQASWEFLTHVAGPISVLLQGMDDQSLQEVRTALMEQYNNFSEGEGFAFPGLTLNVIAE